MMKVLSDIYPPEIKPVRKGPYLALGLVMQSIRVWDGEVWRFENQAVCTEQNLHWRGLAFDPVAASVTSPTGVWIPGATCE
jgi:hypothetical protein